MSYYNRTREEWVEELETDEPEASDVKDILRDWKVAEDEALAREPEYGNCIRGCLPSYLNNNGFCSPNCELGYSRRLGEQDVPPLRRQA